MKKWSECLCLTFCKYILSLLLCCSFPITLGYLSGLHIQNFVSHWKTVSRRTRITFPTCANNLVDSQVKDLRFHRFVDTGSGTLPPSNFEDLLSCLCSQLAGDPSIYLKSRRAVNTGIRIIIDSSNLNLLFEENLVFGPTHEMRFLSSDYLKRTAHFSVVP